MLSSGDSEKIFFRDQIGCLSVDKYIGQQSVQLSLRYIIQLYCRTKHKFCKTCGLLTLMKILSKKISLFNGNLQVFIH